MNTLIRDLTGGWSPLPAGPWWTRARSGHSEAGSGWPGRSGPRGPAGDMMQVTRDQCSYLAVFEEEAVDHGLHQQPGPAVPRLEQESVGIILSWGHGT